MLYIILQPLIDLITSICVRYINPYFTFGILIRSLFLIFTLIYALFISNKKWKKIIFVYCSILALYITIFFINTIINNGTTLIISQFKSIIKVFYFSILLVSFIPIIKETNINTNYLIYSLLGYTSIISITTILGIGFDSYANGSGYGKNGWFYAANEIGTILCILTPFLLLNLINVATIKNKKKLVKQKIIELVTLLFVVISSLWMGTKVPFLGLIFSLFVSLGVCIINIIKKQNRKIYSFKIIGILILFLIIFGVISYSPVGKNLGISINKIINISENNSKSQSHSNIKTVVLSSRDIYYDNTLKEYKNSSIISKLFGIGYITNQDNQILERKNIEIDYFDILFSNGILGFIIYFAPLFIILIYIIKLLWNKKNMIFENNIIFYIYSIFISLIIARLSGHIFTAPAVSFYLALIISQLMIILKN